MPHLSLATANSAKTAHRVPIRGIIIACLVSIAVHTGIWQVWQGTSPEPLPEEKPPMVVEVSLAGAPNIQPPAATPVTSPQPQQPAPVVPSQPKPPEKAKAKPVVKPKPVIKPVVPKKIAPPKEPDSEETPSEKTAPTVATPQPTAPTPVQAPSKPVPAAAPEPLVEAAYSAPGLKNPPIRYPPIALKREWEGTVKLQVLVLANGTAGDISIVSSSGHDILDESAVEQVKAWHFIPAHRGDKTVDGWVKVPISFNLTQ